MTSFCRQKNEDRAVVKVTESVPPDRKVKLLQATAFYMSRKANEISSLEQ